MLGPTGHTMAMQKKLNIKSEIERVLKVLSPRNATMLAARYGIANADNTNPQKRETLESIGQRYGITRERVRQIEEASYIKIRNSEQFSQLKSSIAEVAGFMNAHGGVVPERALMENLVVSSKCPHLALLLALAEEFSKIKESDEYEASWAISPAHADATGTLLADLRKQIEKSGRPMNENELLNLMRACNNTRLDLANDNVVRTLLTVSKQIKKGPFSQWGLVSWSEISPRGVRDKAYLIYEREGRPLHFRDLTTLIDKAGFTSRNSKKTHPQTVHNELIKDDRFVLVGRGMYALVKWGYKPGTVRDVLKSILAEAGGPIEKEELVRMVSKQRMVQQNTILLNLQNRKHFKKTSEGKIYLA